MSPELEREVILKRLQKLMALAAGSEGNEAEVAAQRAAELMAKHQIEQIELELHAGRTGEIPVEMGRIDNETDAPPTRATNTWKQMLASAITMSLGARMIISSKAGGGHTLVAVGPKDSISSARYLYMTLVRELERKVRAFLKATGGKGPQGNAYLQGGVSRLHSRLQDGRAAGLADASTQAMVWVDKTKDAVTKRMEQEFPKLKTGKPVRTANDEGARFAGWQDAGTIDIGGPGRPGLMAPKKELK